MTELLGQGAAAIAAAVQKGKTSAREIVAAHLHDRPLLVMAQRAEAALG
jgi:hypothetical protein